VVPAAVAADLTRRGELLTAHVRAWLARELPESATEVAIFGVGPLTPFAMAAVRALKRRLIGVYAPHGDGSLACAGVTVRPLSELPAIETLWVVAACESPADAAALRVWGALDRTVHVVEPASIRPSAPPFATYAALEGLAFARERRSAGAWLQAEIAYRAILRDPGFTEVGAARYELALVHDALGRAKEAEAGLRWALRHWPAERATVAYNLGSLYERQARWTQAARAFTQALRLTPLHDASRVGGCHFHLGEIALAQQDDARARDHFARAVEALPNHAKARARLAALVTA
jgi:tetratricopeptide (TPR) repeat protein